jgi:putative redox protein
LRVSDVRTEVAGTVDGAPAQFTGITLRVTTGSIDLETLRKLVDIADRGCIMMNTLRGKLDVRIDIEPTS